MSGRFLTGILLFSLMLSPVFAQSDQGTDWYYPPTCETNRDLFLAEPCLEGFDVEELQERLRDLAFYQGPINGAYDDATFDAVIAFQEYMGLEPDGIVKVDTWDHLAMGMQVAAEPEMLPPPGEIEIVIDTSRLTLYIYHKGQVYSKYPVAVGKVSTLTPVGEFTVRNKRYQPGGAFGSRWLGLNIPWGTYGIHGTNRPWSIGTMASAGCIRMHNRHVEEIFPWVKVGTRVTIIGREIRAQVRRDLKKGSLGYDVQYVQLCMRQAGFDAGALDGRFGLEMENTARELQVYYGLPVTGEIGSNERYALGLR